MTIVVGYVPTPEGEAVLARAGEEARLRSEDLLVVSSARGESNISAVYTPTSALALLTADLKAAGVGVEVSHKEKAGDPAAAILEAIDDVGASLVVVGLKKRSAVGKLMLGSTAQTVLLKSNCSVLGVRV
jgi:nucleotide-binding universal stress UspA family protein